MPPKPLLLLLSLAVLLLANCSSKHSDLVVFDSKDKLYSVGFYKNTAMMVLDEDDHIHRLGIRGFERAKGKTDKALWGFECWANGGTYSILTEEPDDPDEAITFDDGKWTRGGKQFIDHVAEAACEIGEAQDRKMSKP